MIRKVLKRVFVSDMDQGIADMVRRLLFLSLFFLLVLQFPFWRNFFIESARNFQSYLVPVFVFFFLYIVFNMTAFGAGRSFLYITACFFSLIITAGPLHLYFKRSDQLIPDYGLKRVTALYANVHTGNKNYQVLADFIENEKPDLVGLVETDKEWLKNLNLKSKYPYHIEKPSDDNFGIAFYSKYPFLGKAKTSLGDDLPPVVIVPVSAKGKKILVGLVHGIPPIAENFYEKDRLLFRRLATHFRNHDGNSIVMGDFNGTVYSYFYKIVKDGAYLQDAALGSGYAKTWDAFKIYMHLIIDHILYGGDLKRLNFRRGPNIGSDHFPLIASFS